MKSLFRKYLKASIAAAIIIVVAGCGYHGQFVFLADAKEAAVRSTWITYWDREAGGKDLAGSGNKFRKLSYFAAYFDESNRLFIPQELGDYKTELHKHKGNSDSYLTFVNDKKNADGSFAMKDIEILRRLFVNDAAMEKHSDEVIALTLQGGYDGIEIDYERIWKDATVGQAFLRFIDKLYAKAMQHHLKLRIVLEPSTPFAGEGFIQGPEYVVMLYNLYGLHSVPGPKANPAFIRKVIAQMAILPGEKEVAFSTGGCLWGDNGEKRFLTELEAKSLALAHDADPRRDWDSRCLVFEYAEKGISYQVWYADVKTLNYWIGIAKEQGIQHFSLWRLGGNLDMHKLE